MLEHNETGHRTLLKERAGQQKRRARNIWLHHRWKECGKPGGIGFENSPKTEKAGRLMFVGANQDERVTGGGRTREKCLGKETSRNQLAEAQRNVLGPQYMAASLGGIK